MLLPLIPMVIFGVVFMLVVGILLYVVLNAEAKSRQSSEPEEDDRV